MLLSTVTAKELTEWRAYEVLNGPLDDTWRDEAMASLVDLVRELSYMTSQAHFGRDSNGNAVQGPVAVPEEPYTRPQYTYLPKPEPSEEDKQAHQAQQLAKLDAAMSAREKKSK